MSDGIDLVSDLSNGDFDAGAGTAVAAPAVIHDAAPAAAPAGTIPANADPLAPIGEPKPSLRDMLSSAYKGAPDPNAAPADAAPVANEFAPGTPESNRRADGTFKSKEELETDKAKIAAAPVQQNQQQQGATRAPAIMSPAELTTFNALPPEMQQFVARTSASIEAHANSLREYDALRQVMTPERLQAWAVNGVTPAQAHHQLYALSDFATRDPVQFITWFAAQRGIDIGKLGEAYVPPDPAMTALHTELQTVKQQLGQFTQGAEQQALNQTITEIEKFATLKDDKGNLVRPYWDELTAEIMPFIQVERANNPNRSPGDVLNAAYERACWGSPSVRAKMQAAADANRLAEQRQQVPAAKAAASSLTGAPNAANHANNGAGNRSLREELRSNFAAFASAV